MLTSITRAVRVHIKDSNIKRREDFERAENERKEEERKKREEKGDTEPKKLSAVAMGFVMAIAGALGVALAVMLFM